MSGALGLLGPSAAPAATTGLPNLQLLPFQGAAVSLDDDELRRALRFPTTVLNQGRFPLEIRGEAPKPQQPDRSVASQCIAWEDNGLCAQTVPAGLLRVRPEYPFSIALEPCYHFDAAATYELRRLLADQTPDFSPAGLVRSTGVRGFPFTDQDASTEHDPGTSTYSIATCGGFARQGLSPGWTLQRNSEDDLGQYIVIDNIVGSFALVGYVDPNRLLRETSDADNRVWMAIHIDTDEVTVLGEGF